MARVSRKKSIASTVTTEKIYNTALYARLSIEDNGMLGNSIENQIYLMAQYVQSKPYLKLCATYSDNGMTGTNFDRPGFCAMMADLRSGKINCVVVKDLSRFGRNYIETGDYLEKIFPCLGVRFISINDDFDSISVNATEALVLSFKSILHATYAKDISKKVCTALNIKKQNGNYIGKFAPLGYKKSAKDKHKLQIDEKTKDIIVAIFKMRLAGIGVTAIARKLNDEGVLNKERYLIQQGFVKPDGKRENSLWRGSTVAQILSNPIYMGAMVERKSDGAYYKGETKKVLPKSEWQLIYDTHDPIISREIFEQLQKIMADAKLPLKHDNKERRENILKGLLVCGECGAKLERDGGYYAADGKLIRHRFVCGRKYIKQSGCSLKSIDELLLIESIFETIRIQIKFFVDIQNIITFNKAYAQCHTQIMSLSKQAANISVQRTDQCFKRQVLYSDLKEGLLSLNAYTSENRRCQAEIDHLTEKLSGIESEQAVLQNAPIVEMSWMEGILKFEKAQNLTRDIALAMIDHIEVHQNSIKIYFSFASEYGDLCSLMHPDKKEGKSS